MKKIYLATLTILLTVFSFFAGDYGFASVIDVFSDQIRVVDDDLITSINPAFAGRPEFRILPNIYEGLVGFDSLMRPQPLLAESWGSISPTTWEFKLRPDIQFSDGSSLDAWAVRKSFRFYQQFPESNIAQLLSHILRVEVIDSRTIRMHTSHPDIGLLNKLNYFYILSPNSLDLEESVYADFIPAGSGRYTVSRFVAEDRLFLRPATGYWDPTQIPALALRFDFVSGRESRMQSFISGQTDLLMAVPPELLTDLRTVSRSGLETKFLGLNLGGGLDSPLSDLKLRAAIATLIDSSEIVSELLSSRVQPASQGVTENVFGFNPDLKNKTFSGSRIEVAQALMLESTVPDGLSLELDLTRAGRVIGEYIQKRLAELSIQVVLRYHRPEELAQLLIQGESQFFLLGYNASTGDAVEFFRSIVLPRDAESVLGFSDPYFSSLLQNAENMKDPEMRARILGELMRRVMYDEHIIIPLFEEKEFYAVGEGLDFVPRIDGSIRF